MSVILFLLQSHWFVASDKWNVTELDFRCVYNVFLCVLVKLILEGVNLRKKPKKIKSDNG